MQNIFTIGIVESFRNLCFSIDMIIYNLITNMFNIFTIISEARILNADIINAFTNRVYLVVSVIMLFVMAYVFLTIIINPDNLTKGKFTPVKLVRNIVLSLSLLLLIPNAFDYAYGVQNSIVSSNVMGKLILGSTKEVNIQNMSGSFSSSVFQASFYLTSTASDEAIGVYNSAEITATADNRIDAYYDALSYVTTGDVEYNVFISTIVGGFVLYLLLTFTFDLAVRAVKLAFYQLISPIPVILFIIPGYEGTLKKWFKATLSTFFELFIRIGVMFFSVFIITVVSQNLDGILGFSDVTGAATRNICRLFIIIGVLIFAKQVPQLISDLFGIKSDSGLLSLRKRLKDSADVIKPVLRPFDKTAGAVGGVIAARKAYKEGGALGINGNFQRSAYATYTGFKTGFKGGLRGVGKAYDAELDHQESYANSPEDEGIVSALVDEARGHFGFGTRYAYIKKRETIRLSGIITPLRERNAVLNKRDNKVISEVNKAHDKYIEDGQMFHDKVTKMHSSVIDNVGKENSKRKISFSYDVGSNGSLDDFKGSSDLSYGEIDYLLGEAEKSYKNGDMTEKDFNEFKAHFDDERIKIQKEYEASRSVINRDMNYHEFEALKSEIDKDPTKFRPELKNKIKEAQDQLVLGYYDDLKTKRVDEDGKLCVDYEALTLYEDTRDTCKMLGTYIGRVDNSTQNAVDFLSMLENTTSTGEGSVLKLKGKSSDVLSQAKMSKDKDLNKEYIDEETGEKFSPKSDRYEHDQNYNKIKEAEKELEKIHESHPAEAENDKRYKARHKKN